MSEKTGNQYFTSGFQHGSMRSGCGMLYDDYSDEAGAGTGRIGTVKVRLPHDGCNTESLNGPVIVVRKGRKNDGN